MSKTITLSEGSLLRICYGSFYSDTSIFRSVRVQKSSLGSIHSDIKKKKKEIEKKEKEGEQNWYLTKHLDSFKDKTDSRFIIKHLSPNQTGSVTQSG